MSNNNPTQPIGSIVRSIPFAINTPGIVPINAPNVAITKDWRELDELVLVLFVQLFAISCAPLPNIIETLSFHAESVPRNFAKVNKPLSEYAFYIMANYYPRIDNRIYVCYNVSKEGDMQDIADILFKKKKCYLEMKEKGEKELITLPTENIYRRTRGSQEYFVLQTWENGKTKSTYFGKDKTAALVMQEKVQRRKQLEKELKQIESDLKAIDKMLKIANKQVGSLDTRDRLKQMKTNENTEANTILPIEPQANTPTSKNPPNQTIT